MGKKRERPERIDAAPRLGMVLIRYSLGLFERQELAEALGVAPSQISMWENGDRPIPEEALEKAARLRDLPRPLPPAPASHATGGTASRCPRWDRATFSSVMIAAASAATADACDGHKKDKFAKADANARTVYIHRLRYDPATGSLDVRSHLRQVTDALPDDPVTAAVVSGSPNCAQAQIMVAGGVR